VEGARFALLPLPERNQSIGQLSVLFLMAKGKAVIASRVMGVTDYIDPEKTGLFYKPGDAKDLTEKIQWMLSHGEETLAMSKNARRAVLEQFNDRLMGKRWERVIDEAIGRDRSHD
jgi:glycosyltransferase involved in cell wall biosynthesis